MIQDIAYSANKDLDAALNEIYAQLSRPSGYGAIIFYASVSTYDFTLLSEKLNEHFSSATVIGTSTSGEISSVKGFTNNSIVVCGLSDNKSKFSGVLINDVDKFPIIQKQEIENAAREAGVLLHSPGYTKDCFALTLINGLCNGEEATLALLLSIIGDQNFQIAGGSAGDDCMFKTTYVSVNGKVATKGAAVMFVKTGRKFRIIKENIFKPSGKKLVLTDVIPETRTITSIDGRNPLERYCEVLGISKSEAHNASIQHPLGRVYGGHVFISSMAAFNPDGTVTMYSRVMKNTEVEVLDPVDEITESKNTCEGVLKDIPNPGCVLLVNCVYRYLQFQQRNLFEKVTATWKNYFGKFCGFSSYGEQIGRQNSNQTLVAVVIEE